MAIEILDRNGQKVINPQGVEAEVGNPFPEIVREITNQGQVEWLNSSPKPKENEVDDKLRKSEQAGK